MKILSLLGSARSKGNTATILGWINEELKAQGHDVEQINLAKKNIKGCLGCAKCKENPNEIACIQKDDAEAILQKIIDADAVIFSSPAYFWGFSSWIKALMDRSWSLVTGYHTPDHKSLIEGKKLALLVTGGGLYDNNVEPLFTAFDRLLTFYKADNTGELFIGKCTIDGNRPEDAMEKAMNFTKGLL